MTQPVDRTPDLRVLERTFRKEARARLAEHFASLARDRSALTAGVRDGSAIAQATLGRLLQRDEDYRGRIAPVIARSRDTFVDLDERQRLAAPPLARETAVSLLAGGGIHAVDHRPGGLMALTMGKDTRAEVRVPPYNDAWTHLEGGRHQQQRAWARRADGGFGFVYTIGQEGGRAWSGAGVEVLFMRDHPGSPPGHGPAGLAQVRAHTPYEFAWRNLSYLGTAHQHAGFGVFVWSAPLDGGPSRIEQDHQYWMWSDGTSWYQDHHNPGVPGRDVDTALNFQHQAPYFPVEPGRVYGAWIWCFGGGDTSGADLVSAAYAQALVDATARFVVIGQQ
ncbi:MAG: hypothetical protein AB7U23_15020 [Dehalococcoidia bacterium]